MGTFEFDYNSDEFLWMFYSLLVPWIWLLVYLFLDPFLVAIMPIIVIIASIDETLFMEPYQIWVEEKVSERPQ